MARQQASRFRDAGHEHGRHRVEYNGRVHGRREGFRVFFGDQGGRYEGEWLNSKRHGRGRQTIGGRFDGVGADVYEGDWVMDRRRAGGDAVRQRGLLLWAVGWIREARQARTRRSRRDTTGYGRGTPRCGTYAPWRTATCPRSFFRARTVATDGVDGLRAPSAWASRAE